ncbi:origin recognition complex subunit 1-like [Drosophila miranda]|uniref:origin recognition complex subunit 1-like n=1 Tax=Drosophila miranda TaxID=7229 RepID=UPI00143FABD3|nr:origin recognition complex subunit 1-like [Drosophila miranda]
MFVSRYKFIKVKKLYRLIPLEIQLDEPDDKSSSRSRSRKSLSNRNEPKSGSACLAVAGEAATTEKRRRASMAAASSLEFVDVNYFNCDNKVSPIKIVGGRSVVRLSEKKKRYSRAEAEVNANYLTASPLTEKNAKVETPKSRASAARRNLNLSLDRGADSAADSDCLNYSIVQQTPDPRTPSNDMKIKLRISERRKSVRLASIDHDPLAVDDPKDTPTTQGRKRLGVNNGDIYHTPTKKAREALDINTGAQETPSTRRKSILKSATSRLAEGTPRRSIQLSNIVEQRVFKDNEIISTPKRGRKTKSTEDADADYSPRFVQKTPTRARRISATAKSTVTPIRGTAATSASAAPITPSQKLKKIRAGELSPRASPWMNPASPSCSWHVSSYTSPLCPRACRVAKRSSRTSTVFWRARFRTRAAAVCMYLASLALVRLPLSQESFAHCNA